MKTKQPMPKQLEPYAKGKLALGVIKLTAGEAKYIFEHMAFERQRDVDFKHVANLTDGLEHDEWVGMSMMLFAYHRGKLWLIDCQHRLRAQAEHGRRIESDAPRDYIVQVVKEDAAVAYARLDSRQKRRGSNVVAEALGLDVPPALVKPALGMAAYVVRYRTRVNPTMHVGTRKVNSADLPYRDSVRYVKDRQPEFKAFGETIEGLSAEDRRIRKTLLGVKVLPIVIETIASRGAYAIEFWRSVLTGENTSKGARYVREKIIEPIPHLARKPDYVRAIAAACGWNAHVSGTLLRSRGESVPVLETDLEVR